MRLSRFATTTIITFLLVIILNADFGYMAQLAGPRLGIDGQFLPQTQVLAQTPEELKAQADELLQQGNQQFKTSQFEAALQSWQKALVIYRKINDKQSQLAVLGTVGLAYMFLEDFTKVIEYEQQTLAIAQEIKHRFAEGSALSRLGNAYYFLGEYTKSIPYHQQSLVIARELENQKAEQKSLTYLGLAYYRLGDYTKTLESHQQSLAIAQELEDRKGEGESLGNLGIAYYSLGDYNKAIAYNDQSLAIALQINDRVGEGNVLASLGIIYYSLGDYTKAIEYYQKSLAIKREIQDRKGEGNVLGNLGIVYNEIGDYAKAIEYQEQRLAIAQEIKYRLGEGAALNNLGRAYYALGDYTKAIEYQEQSLAIAREIKDLAGEGITLDNLGNTFFKSGNLTSAEQTLFAGINVWESIRQKLDNDKNKVSIFEQQARTYRLLQQVLVAQNKTIPALEISERGRSRAFVELLLQRQAARGITPSTSSSIPSAAKIQQVAQEQNATIVEYSIIDFSDDKEKPELYIWVIAPNGNINFRSVDLTTLNTSLANLVTNTRTSMGVRGRGGIEIVYKPGVDETTRLKQLYQILIEPIADLLPTNANERVIFVPHQSLFLVPFAALPDKDGRYLIEKHTILIAPAIQVLELTHKEGIDNCRGEAFGRYDIGFTNKSLTKCFAPDVLIVGNPTMPSIPDEIGGTPIQLPSLPGAEKEAIAIAKLFNIQAITNSQATKAAILAKLPQARIIHFATHGLLDDFGYDVPGALALAPSGNDNGILSAGEILGLNINADLVVLSACDTGRGKITGDGVIGLSRSLIMAGTSSVVVSLWSVPDGPTAELMTKFYRNWQEGLDKGQALRQAMLETMKDHPHPRDWAAFALIGES